MIRVEVQPEPADFDDEVRKPGRFQVELVRFQLHAAPGLPAEIVARIDDTIRTLELNDDACMCARADACEGYWQGDYPLAHLERRFPLLARELRRQDRLVPADRPS